MSILDRRDAITRERCGRMAARLGRPSLAPGDYTADRDLSEMAVDLLTCLLSGVGHARSIAGLRREPSGRLLAAPPNDPPWISIAHDGELAVVAVCDHFPVGVDVQKHDARALSDLVDAVLCPRERACFEKIGPVAFFEAWTRREAALKSVGRSVLTIREFETEDGVDLCHRDRRIRARNAPSPDQAYAIAVALALA